MPYVFGVTERDFELLYRDRHLLVVNKPPGIDVHGRNAEDRTSLIYAVARRLSLRPARLHPASRLDRPVSGVVPIASSKIGRRSLTEQYQRREVHRRYLALVAGVPEPREGEWNEPIGTDRHDPRRRRVRGRDARPASTRYRVLWTVDERWSMVELEPGTGRTHQLRVHLSEVARCPIAGDRRYGGGTVIGLPDGGVIPVPRVMLHAERIALRHPESGELMVVEAELWDDFKDLIEYLKV